MFRFYEEGSKGWSAGQLGVLSRLVEPLAGATVYGAAQGRCDWDESDVGVERVV